MNTISVPVNLISLGAAVTARVEGLTVDSSPDDILAIIGLVETLESALDRLALAFEPITSINTVAA